MELRPYQNESITAIKAEWEQGRRKTLLVLPTGTGKTIVFSMLAKQCAYSGESVLILAHREELLNQAADKLRSATGMSCAVEKAENTSGESLHFVTVGSVQTMMRQNRLDRFDCDHYDVVIVDEAHHCLSESYQRIFSHFPGAKVLGVTATPDRGDRRDLGSFFDSIAYEYHLPKAIKDGYLCRIKAQTVPLEIDLGALKVTAGDFSAGECGSALEPYLPHIAAEYAKVGRDRKGMIFTPLCATAQTVCEYLKAEGIRAYYASGEDRSKIAAFENDGPGSCIVNAMLLTEGYDHPQIDLISVLRPTKVRSLYCQMVGRGTRPSPGKDHLLLLDFLWHTERHELCRPAHLIAETDEIAKRMVADAEAEAGADPADIEEAHDKAETDAVAAREEALAKVLAEMRKRKRKLVDPLQYAMSIGDTELAEYQPSFGWEAAPPSADQISGLEKMGIYAEGISNAGMAAKMLDRARNRVADGMATARQVRLLEQYDYQHVGAWSFARANQLISRIAANNWRKVKE